jgi:hypothetical protein
MAVPIRTGPPATTAMDAGRCGACHSPGVLAVSVAGDSASRTLSVTTGQLDTIRYDE